jgi:hypothetical protein
VAPQAAAATSSSALLAWAEATYPTVFPGVGQDGTYGVFSYRYYSGSGNYIGFSGNSVYVLGPFGPQISYVGELSDFSCRIAPLDCADSNALSAQQQLFDGVFRGTDTYSAFNVFRGRLDGTDIAGQPGFFASFASLRLPSAPTSGTVAFTRSDSPLSANFMAMPDSYTTCPITPAGADLSVYQMFDVYLGANGQLAKICRRYASTIEYSGSDVLWHRTDGAGNTVRTFKITTSAAVDVAGLNIVTDIGTSGATVSAFSSRLAGNAATYPAGSLRVTVAGEATDDFFQVVSFDSQYKEPSALKPVPASGGSGDAATIEQALPWADSYPEGVPYALGSGTIMNFHGRRVWVATYQTTKTSVPSHRAFVEIDGKVYCGFFITAGTPNAYYAVYVNAIGKTAVQATALHF